MPAKKPNVGQLDNGKVVFDPQTGISGPGITGIENRRAVKERGDGSDRDRFEHRGRGLRIRLNRIPQTSRKVLASPYFFQVPPLETFSTQHAYNFSDYETVSTGQFSRQMSRQLRIVEFQTMFVDQDWFYTLFAHTKRGPNPQKLARELVHILNTGTPFRLMIGQPRLWGEGNWDVNMKATLRSLTVEEKAGEVDARYVNVSFTEWRELDIKKDKKGERLPLTYTIRDGDTLRQLAKKYYGETRVWRLIARSNQLGDTRADEDLSTVRKNGKRLQTLYLPRPPAREGDIAVGLGQAVD